jgi:triosephosphate isomerase
MRQKIIIGNHKMNGNKNSLQDLLAEISQENCNFKKIKIVICPPAIYSFFNENSSLNFGAQNISTENNGAWTGEISGEMLLDAGYKYVIIGHSERRQNFGENDEIVVKKIQQARQNNLQPILCVGETLAERDENRAEEIIAKQIKSVLDSLEIEQLENLIIAYEPIWAIGTGQTATPDEAQKMHQFIRECVTKNNPVIAEKIQIIYGGSMKPENAKSLLNMPDIDGGLIGGAALVAKDFLSICQSAEAI